MLTWFLVGLAALGWAFAAAMVVGRICSANARGPFVAAPRSVGARDRKWLLGPIVHELRAASRHEWTDGFRYEDGDDEVRVGLTVFRVPRRKA